MDSNQEILKELKNINQKIEKFTKPSKSIWLNFLNGTFHSLGTIFGTAIVTLILIYVFSQFNFTKSISTWMENTLSNVKWEKIFTPQIQQIKQTETKSAK
ncbi:MAG: DUF5665 domain-containing protein [Candidatus Shapirobacteria bacterium]|nr:DUF5665 domain-containing protein [Candidatus Shapirobacteria bacterium]MDD4410584.1 DUF5665 domain-containing protein [Candidatus Shapirobacteria bacterium]